jgi:hypothetical protein
MVIDALTSPSHDLEEPQRTTFMNQLGIITILYEAHVPKGTQRPIYLNIIPMSVLYKDIYTYTRVSRGGWRATTRLRIPPGPVDEKNLYPYNDPYQVNLVCTLGIPAAHFTPVLTQAQPTNALISDSRMVIISRHSQVTLTC